MKNKILEILNNNVTESKNDYNKIYEKDFDNLINEIIAAISVTHCCTELKDKEVISFEDWLKVNDYQYNSNEYVKYNKTYYYTDLKLKYTKEINNF